MVRDMPPSPALRCSPGREPRGNHRRGRSLSFEAGMIVREKDEDLALFNEMQTREKEDFLLQSDDLEDTFCKMTLILWFWVGVYSWGNSFFVVLLVPGFLFMFLVLQLQN